MLSSAIHACGITELPEWRDSTMPTATSKLSSKYQATIPEAVCRVMGLRASDAVAFDIEGQ
jgi:hypothetical protein